MIELNCIPGSAEWDRLHLGVMTSRYVTKLITPKKLQLSASADDVLYRLLAERMSGERADEWGGNYWTERGLEMEPEVHRLIRFEHEIDIQPFGFAFRDESKRVGASPDGATPDRTIIHEGKAPALWTHLRYLDAGVVPSEYMPQAQWHLWVTGAERLLWTSYHPDADMLSVMLDPDAQWQDAFDEHVPAFITRLDEAWERLRHKEAA